MTIRILTGDCRAVLASLPDASVQCCVTSPPYYGLREYGTATWEGGDLSCDHVVGELRTGLGLAKLGERYRGGGHKQAELGKVYAKGECPKCGALRIDKQIGLEPTPAEYVEQMVAVFREVRRVLRDDGTVWLNLGDSYAGGGGFSPNAPSSVTSKSGLYGGLGALKSGGIKPQGLMKAKDLLGIPWRVAFALQADGWWLRSDIIWAKPNPMPESVTDRPTSAHEHVFLLTKRERYFFDAEAVREPATSDRPDMRLKGVRTGQAYLQQGPIADNTTAARERASPRSAELDTSAVDASGRNCRNVWTIATSPYPDAHFATFPPELAERCIKAGTSERGCCAKCGAPWVRQVERSKDLTDREARGKALTSPRHDGNAWNENDGRGFLPVETTTTGWQPSCACNAAVVPCTVLDPFGGAGTTALVADRLGRNAILIELNPAYAAMAERRIHGDAPLFADVAAQ